MHGVDCRWGITIRKCLTLNMKGKIMSNDTKLIIDEKTGIG